MRTKDESKIKAIKTAVIDLSQQNGFNNLTTAKVAKKAGVSPATIYLYYQDKTDLLSRLYEEVKRDLHVGLAVVIQKAGGHLEDQLRAMLMYSVQQARRYPQESHFVSTLWTNQELLDDHAIAFGRTTEGPLVTLFQRLAASDEFVDAAPEVIESLATVPTLIYQLNTTISDQAIEQGIELVIKAMKA